jgi:hypothetical protein
MGTWWKPRSSLSAIRKALIGTATLGASTAHFIFERRWAVRTLCPVIIWFLLSMVHPFV